MEKAQALGAAFIAAARADDGAFFSEQHDAVTICASLTGDWDSLRRWRQLVRAKGEGAVRDEAFALWREIRAGEDVDNRGAVLNARLAALADEKTGGAS